MNTSRQYAQADFDGEKQACDLIMKGGITSGVVYPLAITEVATKYRLVSVGGTSAGAIVAGMAAAAEYDRKNGGFLRLASIPADISERLLSLFQPAPQYRSLFKTFLSGLGEQGLWRKLVRVLITALRNH